MGIPGEEARRPSHGHSDDGYENEPLLGERSVGHDRQEGDRR